MKLTKDNYKEYVPEKDQNLFESLLIDLQELNQILEDNDEKYRQLYIDIETEHTEYSAERVEPCPDYFGMYTLRFELNPYETVGTEMTIHELDSAMCILCNFIESKLS